MRDRGIDGDHQVERRDRRRRVGEVREFRRQILDRDLAALELLEVGGVRAELQAHERGAGHGKERRHHRKFDGAAEIVGVLGIAGPDHADLQSLQMGEALLPALGRVGRGAQIGHGRGNGFEPRLQEPGQAEQRGIAVVWAESPRSPSTVMPDRLSRSSVTSC